MLNDKRQFKEVSPDKPVDHRIGNTFASKPEAEKQTQILTIYVTADEKKQCEAAAKKAKLKVGPWARQTLLGEADSIICGEPFTTRPPQETNSPNKA